MHISFIAPLCAFLVSLGTCLVARDRFFLDAPNERSAHTRPTSRFGGVAIFLGSVLGLSIAQFINPLWAFDITAFSLVGFLWLLGVIDDYKHVSVYIKFVGQAVFALLVMGIFHLFLPLPEAYSHLSYPLTLLFIMGFINASNFSDGLNGLWSGTVIIGLLWFSVLGNFDLSKPIFIYLAAILGFFILNYPRGLIFLGDSGSTFLGGLVLIYGVHLAARDSMYLFPIYKNLLAIFSPFVFVFSDIAVTLLKRLFQGHHPFVAHKNHFKQKLVHELGLSHGLVTFIYLCGSLLGIGTLGVGGFMDEGLSFPYLVCLGIFLGIKCTFMGVVQLLCILK